MHLCHFTHVRRYRQVGAVRPIGDLEKLLNAGQAHHVRFHIVHGARINELAEMGSSVDLLAKRNRRTNRLGQAAEDALL